MAHAYTYQIRLFCLRSPRRRSQKTKYDASFGKTNLPSDAAECRSHISLHISTCRPTGCLVGVTRSAEEKPTAQRTLPARKHGRWLNAASRRARDTSVSLRGRGGEVWRVAESWDNHTRRNCVALKSSRHSSAGHVAWPRPRQPTRPSGSRPWGYRRAS